jgi:K+-transporting ATPase ATPase C chain
MKTLFPALRSSFMLIAVMTVLLGAVYPLTVMAVAQTMFHHKANGSLIERGGMVVGSHWLGQQFESPKYFWGRLSATTPPYNAANSSGSNFSPANPKLLEAANARIAALRQVDPQNHARIPVDLVTSSASGLDPHISLSSALYQLHRVAQLRGLKDEEMHAFIERYTERPFFGLLGRPYVNILELNFALDDLAKGEGKEIR